MVAYYLTQNAFAYDVETVGERRGVTVVNTVSWISFATNGRCDVIPMGHPNGEYLETIYPLTGQGELRKSQGKALRKTDLSRSEKKQRLSTLNHQFSFFQMRFLKPLNL